MITIFTGVAGSGKTLEMANILRKHWKRGEMIYTNFPLWFDEERSLIKRWHNLAETYHLQKGILAIDESQKLLDARKWAELPVSFTEKIAMHRHHHIDIYTTTQDIGHIDVRMRTNAHEIIECRSLFRFPKSQREKPLLQISKITRKSRAWDQESDRIKWTKTGSHLRFISRIWTKTYFDTYGDVGTPKFLCRIFYQRKNPRGAGTWQARIYSRDLVNHGKARI
jgi:hypothetical protein